MKKKLIPVYVEKKEKEKEVVGQKEIMQKRSSMAFVNQYQMTINGQMKLLNWKVRPTGCLRCPQLTTQQTGISSCPRNKVSVATKVSPQHC